MIYLAGGLMRTGSTLMYQIMSELVLMNGGRAPRPERITEEMVVHWMDEPTPVVIKQHVFDEDTFTPALNFTRAVVTVRDPRDVAVSLMNFHDKSFEDVLRSNALLNWIHTFHSWQRPDSLFVRYESLVDDPVTIIMMVSRYMSMPVSEHMAAYISRKWSKESNLDRSRQDNPLRSRHFFARRHIRSGAVGQWRELSQDQQRQLNTVVGEWVTELGYNL